MVITDTRVIQRTTAALKKVTPYVIHQGGSNSGKTFGNIYSIISYLLFDRKKEVLVCSVVAQTVPQLKRGAIRDFLSILEMTGLSSKIQWNISDKKATFPNGSIIEFFSVDNEQRAKEGKRDLLFVNEANNLKWMIFWQLKKRTRLSVIIDYNPSSRFWLHHKLMPSLLQKDYLYTHTTYKDNPTLTNKEVYEIENEPDDYLRTVYTLGKTGKLEGVIFTHYNITDSFPINAKNVGYGMDFGFNPDPTVLVKCGIYDNAIYIQQLVYEDQLLNRQLADRLKDINFGKRDKIYADNQDVTIKELKNIYGYNVTKAPKGKGSVKSGIKLLKSYKIYFVKGSENAMNDFDNFKWKVIDGINTGEPVNKFKHTFDSINYYMQGNILKRPTGSKSFTL